MKTEHNGQTDQRDLIDTNSLSKEIMADFVFPAPRDSK